MKHQTAAAILLAACAAPAFADGMLDPTFGNGGTVLTNFSGFSQDEARAVAVQPDGRIVVAGGTASGPGQFGMAVARYLTSGLLDDSFGTGGRVTLPSSEFGGSFVTGRDMLLQPDGRILLVGGFNGVGGDHFALARLNVDGTRDLSFGPGGTGTLIRSFPGGASAQKGVLQTDGRIVVLGATTDSLSAAFARYNADGSLDPGFGTGGRVTVPVPVLSPYRAVAVALQADGKIVALGTGGQPPSPSVFVLVRLLPGGGPDPGFGAGGVVNSSFGIDEFASGLALLDDGRIVVSGSVNGASTRDLALARFLANGALDTTWGTGGLARVDSDVDEVSGPLLLQPDGKFVLGGIALGTPDSDFLLARILADGQLDTGFGSGGFLRHGFIPGETDQAAAIALAGPGRLVMVGRADNPASSIDFGVARYDATTPVEALSFTVE